MSIYTLEITDFTLKSARYSLTVSETYFSLIKLLVKIDRLTRQFTIRYARQVNFFPRDVTISIQ
jgi:hypothetical protein